MNMFANLSMDDSIQGEKDVLGGGGSPIESGAYDAEITLAYLKQSAKKAMALEIHAKLGDGRNYRETFWITSGEDKGCKNTYQDKEGNQQYLPSFLMANSLATLACGSPLRSIMESTVEKKKVPIYNFTSRQEELEEVPVITGLIGKSVTLGILRKRINKQAKNDQGNYVDTNEERFITEIDKVFEFGTHLTSTEKAAGGEAEFYKRWVEEKTGNTVDLFKEVKGAPPAAGASAPAGNSLPTESLFD